MSDEQVDLEKCADAVVMERDWIDKNMSEYTQSLGKGTELLEDLYKQLDIRSVDVDHDGDITAIQCFDDDSLMKRGYKISFDRNHLMFNDSILIEWISNESGDINETAVRYGFYGQMLRGDLLVDILKGGIGEIIRIRNLLLNGDKFVLPKSWCLWKMVNAGEVVK